MGKYGFTVDNVAVAGSTASRWAREKEKLKEAVDANPDAKYVWLTIGGNDAMPKLLSMTPIDDIIEHCVEETRIFLDVLFEAHPDIKVVQFPYDILNFQSFNLLCNALGTMFFNGYCGLIPSKRCSNELFMRLHDYVEKVSSYYDNHHSVNLVGAL